MSTEEKSEVHEAIHCTIIQNKENLGLKKKNCLHRGKAS